MTVYARLIDTAAGFLTAQQLQASGYDGCSAWTSSARPGSGLSKPSRKADLDAIRAAGKSVFSNFQYGKPAAPYVSDFRRGFDGGVADAYESSSRHQQLGGPAGAPHYFSIDEDVNLATWNSLCAPWLRGAAAVIGVERVGIYGSRNALTWSREDAAARWFWQARGWRGPGYLDWAHIHQVAVDTRISGIPFAVDLNEVVQPRWGAWHEYEGPLSSLTDSEQQEVLAGFRQLSRPYQTRG